MGCSAPRSWVTVFPTIRDPSEPPLGLGDLQLRWLSRTASHDSTGGLQRVPLFFDSQRPRRHLAGAHFTEVLLLRLPTPCSELWPLCHSHKLVNLNFSPGARGGLWLSSQLVRSSSGSEALLVVQLLATRPHCEGEGGRACSRCLGSRGGSGLGVGAPELRNNAHVTSVQKSPVRRAEELQTPKDEWSRHFRQPRGFKSIFPCGWHRPQAPSEAVYFEFAHPSCQGAKTERVETVLTSLSCLSNEAEKACRAYSSFQCPHLRSSVALPG